MAKQFNSLEEIFSSPAARRYQKGHVVFHQDDQLTHVGFLKKGFVKVYNINSEGEERILLLIGPGMPFPYSLEFRKNQKIRYFYEAFTDSLVHTTPREQVEKVLRNNKEAKLLLAEKLEELMVDLTQRVAIFENKNAVDKVAQLLPYLIKTCGEQITENVYAIKFKITHQDVANMTGLARETASIQLKRLENSGVLTQKRSFTVIDLSQIPHENSALSD